MSFALGRDWRVVQAQPNRETHAASDLAKQGFEVFLRLFVQQVGRARRIRNVAAALFPRYLFVRMVLQTRWRSVRGGIGVVWLIIVGKSPLSVAKDIVEGLMAQRNQAVFIVLPRRGIGSGDMEGVCIDPFAESLDLVRGD